MMKWWIFGRNFRPNGSRHLQVFFPRARVWKSTPKRPRVPGRFPLTFGEKFIKFHHSFWSADFCQINKRNRSRVRRNLKKSRTFQIKSWRTLASFSEKCEQVNCRNLEMSPESLCGARKILTREPLVATFRFHTPESKLSEIELSMIWAIFDELVPT